MRGIIADVITIRGGLPHTLFVITTVSGKRYSIRLKKGDNLDFTGDKEGDVIAITRLPKPVLTFPAVMRKDDS